MTKILRVCCPMRLIVRHAAVITGFSLWISFCLPKLLSQERNAQRPEPMAKWVRALSFDGDGKKPAITATSFSPCGRSLVAGSADGALFTWDVRNPTEGTRVQAHKGLISSLVFSADGKLYASAGEDRLVIVWEAATGKKVHTLTGHKNTVAALTFSPNSKTLASAGHDNIIRLWELDSLKCKELARHKGRVTGIVFAPDGNSLISGGVIKDTFSLNNGNSVSAGQTDYLCAWNPAKSVDPEKLASRGAWLSLSPDGHHLLAAGIVLAVASENGATALTATDSIDLVDLVTGSICLKLRGRGCRAVFSPDGKTFATTAGMLNDFERLGVVFGGGPKQDGRLCLWETATRRAVAILGEEEYTTIAFSPTLTRIAAGKTNGIDLLDIPKGPRTTPTSADAIKNLWEQLAHDDPAIAYKALHSLADAGDDSVAFLRKSLSPVPHDLASRLNDLLDKLEDKGFEVRDRATRDLLAYGKSFEPMMRLELRRSDGLERRRALLRILSESSEAAWDKNQLRSVRAIQVLELIGSGNAIRLLDNLGGGARGSRITEDSLAASKRLQIRK